MNTYSALIRPLNGSIGIFLKAGTHKDKEEKADSHKTVWAGKVDRIVAAFKGQGMVESRGRKGGWKARCQKPSRLRNPHTTRHSWNRGKRGDTKSRRIHWQRPWEAQTSPLYAQCFGAVSQGRKPSHCTDQNKGSLHWARQVQRKAGTTELKKGSLLTTLLRLLAQENRENYLSALGKMYRLINNINYISIHLIRDKNCTLVI